MTKHIRVFYGEKMTLEHKIMKLYNVGCEHCAQVCDKAFGERHYAYAELVEGTLFVDAKNPAAIIPALHLLEYFVSKGYKIDKVHISTPGEYSESLSESGIHDTHDLSEWTIPNKKSYVIVKKGSADIEDVLNLYKDVLTQSSENGVPIGFPRDLIIKSARKTKIDDIKTNLKTESIPYFENSEGALGFIEETVTNPLIINDVSDLPQCHIRESIKIQPKQMLPLL